MSHCVLKLESEAVKLPRHCKCDRTAEYYDIYLFALLCAVFRNKTIMTGGAVDLSFERIVHPNDKMTYWLPYPISSLWTGPDSNSCLGFV
jgi:hypothetical protein